jgi:hypothetical protein
MNGFPHDRVSSIRMTRTSIRWNCEVYFFKNDNWGDCKWHLMMPDGSTTVSSQHFDNDAGDSASSFTIAYGATLPNPHNRGNCGNVNYHGPNCNSCNTGRPWCING